MKFVFSEDCLQSWSAFHVLYWIPDHFYITAFKQETIAWLRWIDVHKWWILNRRRSWQILNLLFKTESDDDSWESWQLSSELRVSLDMQSNSSSTKRVEYRFDVSVGVLVDFGLNLFGFSRLMLPITLVHPSSMTRKRTYYIL